ncbi:hypothetical protein MWU61_15225 [Loktanella sp. F6476L]|mgnify:FL=1|uniref:hypothetical protein n=1 Tax=Loktanella sp. F6476L TaxID=2926405 RepID=UPI001FF50D66|nr:hypothetical protein [Loktanella sp. F6476L]MCK0121902.1 hypothetical protein [Loktanella sp. F6476L]
MRNMHPADELAMIRTDIRRLREREDYLRKGFLSLRLPTHGVDAVATVKIVKNRRLCQHKLPAHLLDDPDLWETQVIRHVHIDEVGHPAAQIPMWANQAANCDLIEPI